MKMMTSLDGDTLVDTTWNTYKLYRIVGLVCQMGTIPATIYQWHNEGQAGQHVPACSSHLCHMISREARMSASVVTAMGLHTALARPIPMTWLRHSHIQLALLKDK